MAVLLRSGKHEELVSAVQATGRGGLCTGVMTASRTTVYAQFPDKDSALIALHQDFGARVVAAVVEAHERAAGDWPERLRRMGDWLSPTHAGARA